MFRPYLIKKIKPVDKQVPIAKNTWIQAAEDVCCGENIHEYLNSTSLHGMKYIANRNTTLFERYVLWAIKNFNFFIE